MVHIEWYRRLPLASRTEESIREYFVRTLVESNRDVGFFVDWKKVRSNVDAHSTALATLGEVYGSADPLEKLKSVILVHPQALRALPMLLAWREDRWVILEEDSGGEFRSSVYDFSGAHSPSESEAERVASFCKSSGILRVLAETSDLRAYLLGVEAGMDTNARKNRSGAFMENHVDPYVTEIERTTPAWRVFRQKRFGYLKERGVSVPEELLARRFDYAFVSASRRVSIEVSYYDKLGSKPQETADSYIERAGESRGAGWDFVWITDGPGWKENPPQIGKAFHRLDAVLNLAFCRQGILQDVLASPALASCPNSAVANGGGEAETTTSPDE